MRDFFYIIEHPQFLSRVR